MISPRGEFFLVADRLQKLSACSHLSFRRKMLFPLSFRGNLNRFRHHYNQVRHQITRDSSLPANSSTISLYLLSANTEMYSETFFYDGNNLVGEVRITRKGFPRMFFCRDRLKGIQNSSKRPFVGKLKLSYHAIISFICNFW